MVTRIYDRPDLDQGAAGRPLFVTGTLPPATERALYEGRLQIHNAIGACTARQIAGDALPPGHSIYVDNSTAEVVITWPAYVEQAAPIQNPGFEDGMAGWAAGAGWSVTTNNAITGSRSAVYQRNGGSSVISSQSRYPVNPGVPISAQCQVRQGASSAGNAGAGLRLEFRDAAGDVIDRADGNYVMSASKNAVYPSNVTAFPPANAATVNVAGVGVRHRENKDVWIDSFSWNHRIAAVGLALPRAFVLTIEVRDSAGRTAIWTGAIGEVVTYLTSKLYPFEQIEPVVQLSAQIIGFVHKNTFKPIDAPVEAALLAAEIVGFIHKGEEEAPPVIEVASLSAGIVGFIHGYPPSGSVAEPVMLIAEITGFRHRSEPLATVAEATILSAQITGFIHA